MELTRSSARFGVLIFCLVCAVAFAAMDLIATYLNLNKVNGVNPYWRVSRESQCPQTSQR